MAEIFLEEMYREADLVCDLKQIVEYAKVHDEYHVVELGNKMLPRLGKVCKAYIQQDMVKGTELWNAVQQLIHVDDDLILRGDIMEGRILPLLEEKVKRYGGPIYVENDEQDYCFESSESGFLTLKELKRNKYIHSGVDPMWEAKKLADYIYEPRKAEYSIRGCGLGYLIYQLYRVSNETAIIHVFEKDARIVEYARRYGVLDWVPEDKLNVIVDADPGPFLRNITRKDMGYYILAPELYNEQEDAREVLEEIYEKYTAPRKISRDLEINYWHNIRSHCRLISEFDSSGLQKDFVVIAAGPSLDSSMEFLKESQGKKTLIAVGTVFRKLLEADIVPDLVAVLDPLERIYRQIEGLEDQKIPLLLGMTAYWRFAENYQGEKYKIPITDSPGEGENKGAWVIGGTVTHLAMEAAIRFGAEKIYLAGVDLAYPQGLSHAEGTMDRSVVKTEGMIPVEGVGGTVVYSDRLFNSYRQWIEQRIESTPWITYYNMSRIGARIAGTREQNG